MEMPTLEYPRVYAIGDIHGRSDLLDRMVETIARDMTVRPAPEALTVVLGDYIDRGPDSRGVIERLLPNPFGMPLVPLKGNHEAMLGTFLREPSSASGWRRWGGLETLHSYGVDVTALQRSKGYEAACKALHTALPVRHMEFFDSLKLSLSVGPYFLCHAGIRPSVPLARQCEDDLLWIRDEFLDCKADFGKIVVHGHTPIEKPQHLHNRINVDTGAFMTGCLTCAVLEPNEVRFLSVY